MTPGVTDSTPTVAVVDDERELADTYADWLDGKYDVRVAYSGDEALETVDESVDVLLLDRRMPGLSGDEVLERVRDRGLACRVAMLTAVEPEVDIVEMGFDDYVVKPVFQDGLRSTVERLHARADYDAQVQQYFSLAAKRATLKEHHTAKGLDGSSEFGELKSELAQVREHLDDVVERLDAPALEREFRRLDGV